MDKTSDKYYTLCIYLVLILATGAVYWQVRGHEFINFDDDLYIFSNSHVKAGLTREGLVWAFTKIHAYNWHPLTWVSHMLDCELYGLEPGGHHFTNVLFHIANALLLLSVLRRMTGNLYSSAFVAALFALHPLHVESVAWVSERKDVLSAFFWILTMLAYVRYAERPNIARYLLIVLAFCLGLLAKQMLVTLPFVLLLLDYWPLGRFAFKGQSFCNPAGVVPVSVRRCILEKIPLLILSVVAGMIVYLVQHYVGTVKSFIEYPLLSRIENAVVAYVVYIGKTLWPINLAIFYPHQHKNLPVWQITGAALLLVCITTAVLWKIRQKPYLAVGWFWYLGTLVPVIGLVQVGLQAYADRYTYIPLTGLFIMIAWGIPDIFARLRYRKAVLSSSAVLLLLALGIMAWRQVGYWCNGITLYRHATVVVQNNWWAHHALGGVLEIQGKLDEAVVHFTESLKIDPYNANIKNDLGKVLLKQGKIEEAAKLYQQFLPKLPDDINDPNAVGLALARRPELVEVVRVYTEAHANLGIAFFQQGKFDEAIRHCEEVLRFRPEFAYTYKSLGDTLLRQGNLEEAIKVYQKVLQILPNDPDAYGGLGIALGQQGKLDEAITCFTKALAIEPASAEVRSNLGYALLLKGRIDEAIKEFREALRLNPDWVSLLDRLARLLAIDKEAKYHNPEEAIRLAERACELSNYELPEVLDTLAIAYSAMGRFTQAIETAERALKLAEAAGKENLAKEIQERLQLYKSNRPYSGK